LREVGEVEKGRGVERCEPWPGRRR
jgi:hypothetical protein